jgi:serine/threonine protein kinase
MSKELGRGSFGIVQRLDYKGNTYALKTIRLQFAEERDKKGMATELTLGKSLHHLNIIPITHYIVNVSTKTVAIIMPLATCDLKSILNEHTQKEKKAAKKLPLPKAHSILMQVLAGIEYMHKCKIVHRDVKPSNVLITQNQVTNEEIVQICDFGLGGFKGDEDERTDMGSPWYTAPEVLAAKKDKDKITIEPARDIYSLGVLFAELLGGWKSVEWWALHRILAADMSSKMHDVILSMLDNEPGSRPSAAEVRAKLGGPTKEEDSSQTPTETQLTKTYQKFLEEVQKIQSECIYRRWLTEQFKVTPDALERLFGSKPMTWESLRDINLQDFQSDSEYSKLENAKQFLKRRDCMLRAKEWALARQYGEEPEGDTVSDEEPEGDTVSDEEPEGDTVSD